MKARQGLAPHFNCLAVTAVSLALGMMNGVAGAEDIPNVIGMTITKARATLVHAGWQPRKSTLKLPDGELARSDAQATMLFKGGIVEIEYCSGTGTNFCFFNYRRNGRCLRLTTAGEYQPGFEPVNPVVSRQSTECPPRKW